MMTDSLPVSLTPLQIAVFALEVMVYLAGAGLWVWWFARGAGRKGAQWMGGMRMQPWDADMTGFMTGVALVVTGALGGQAAMVFVTQKFMGGGGGGGGEAALLLQGAGFQLGMLAGAALTLALMRNAECRVQNGDGAAEVGGGDVAAPTCRTSSVTTIRHSALAPALAGVAVFAMALPLMIAVAAAWQWAVRACGFKVSEQDLVGLFARSGSWSWIVAMSFFAVVVAPLTEELIFRGGLFRFLHRRVRPGWAMAISGAVFGAVHWDLSVFGPLCVLGMLLALAYERTGSIVVPMVAHALFNLNTIVLVLAGFGPAAASN
ncbi:CPBP family intramembrane metalloprotease [Opitutaceae bacterium TAV3]|nr:CPBP family intramembrane metalloprotease [Opitutaceae bacterium TAV3]